MKPNETCETGECQDLGELCSTCSHDIVLKKHHDRFYAIMYEVIMKEERESSELSPCIDLNDIFEYLKKIIDEIQNDIIEHEYEIYIDHTFSILIKSIDNGKFLEMSYINRDKMIELQLHLTTIFRTNKFEYYGFEEGNNGNKLDHGYIYDPEHDMVYPMVSPDKNLFDEMVQQGRLRIEGQKNDERFVDHS